MERAEKNGLWGGLGGVILGELIPSKTILTLGFGGLAIGVAFYLSRNFFRRSIDRRNS